MQHTPETHHLYFAPSPPTFPALNLGAKHRHPIVHRSKNVGQCPSFFVAVLAKEKRSTKWCLMQLITASVSNHSAPQNSCPACLQKTTRGSWKRLPCARAFAAFSCILPLSSAYILLLCRCQLRHCLHVLSYASPPLSLSVAARLPGAVRGTLATDRRQNCCRRSIGLPIFF